VSENAVGATSDTYRPGDDAGKMASTDDRFESERERAIEDLEREDVLSFYVGTLLDEGGTQAIEYRLRTDSEDPEELHNTNLIQVAMLLSVMAEQSNASLEEIAEAGVERARAGNLHQRV
jgi:hypothetical protein